MHIGMIVGIGPAATDYYRYLISAMAKAGFDRSWHMPQNCPLKSRSIVL